MIIGGYSSVENPCPVCSTCCAGCKKTHACHCPPQENTWAPGTPVTAAATGLTGLIVVDSLEEAKTAEGLPQDIDVEYPLLFEAIDEAQSAFFPQNVLRHGLNGPANAGRLAAMASDPVRKPGNPLGLESTPVCAAAEAQRKAAVAQPTGPCRSRAVLPHGRR